MPTDDELNFDTAAPVSLHPQVFLAIEGVDEDSRPFLEASITAFDSAVKGLAAIYEARLVAAKNPALTPESVVTMTANYADKKVAEITRQIDAAHDTLKAQIANADKALQHPLEASLSHPLSVEIRAFAKAMTAGERRKFVSDAIAANDTQALSAVLGGPHYLSGLTTAEKEQFTRLYREKASPALANRLRVMQRAFDILGERGGLVMTHATKLIGADRRKVNALRDADAKMQKAFAK